MILVVGLGNVGDLYQNTRHNAGFMLIDLFLQENPATLVSNSKFKGELYKMGSSLLLLKPGTFMNASGVSVKAVSDFYKCERIIVVHDDIDLNLGALKFKKGGSNGGHNGLKSIDELCGSEYERIRIGIGKAPNVVSHVLSAFKNEEKELLSKVLNHAKEALLKLLQSDITQVASNYTLKA